MPLTPLTPADWSTIVLALRSTAEQYLRHADTLRTVSDANTRYLVNLRDHLALQAAEMHALAGHIAEREGL